MCSVSRASCLLHHACLNKRIGLQRVAPTKLPSMTLSYISFARNSAQREFCSLQRNINQEVFGVNSLYFNIRWKLYPIREDNIRHLSWNSFSNYFSGSSMKNDGSGLPSSSPGVISSSENAITDSQPETNIVVDSLNPDTGTQLLTEFPQQMLDFLHVQLHLPLWSGLIILTCGFCLSTTVLYVAVMRSLQRFILPNNLFNAMEKLLSHHSVKVDGFKSGSIVSVLRCNHFFNILQTGLLFTVFLNGLHGPHLVDAASMQPGGLFWFTDLTVSDPYLALPAITSITYLFIWRVKDYILLEDTDPELRTKLTGTFASPFVYRTELSKSLSGTPASTFSFKKMLKLSCAGAWRAFYGMYASFKRSNTNNSTLRNNMQGIPQITANAGKPSFLIRQMMEITMALFLPCMYFYLLFDRPAGYALCFATMNIYSLVQFYIIKYMNVRDFLESRVKPNVETPNPSDHFLKGYEECYSQSLQQFQREIQSRSRKNNDGLFNDPKQSQLKSGDSKEMSESRQEVNSKEKS